MLSENILMNEDLLFYLYLTYSLISTCNNSAKFRDGLYENWVENFFQ